MAQSNPTILSIFGHPLDLTDIVVLVGRGDSGKTYLLETLTSNSAIKFATGNTKRQLHYESLERRLQNDFSEVEKYCSKDYWDNIRKSSVIQNAASLLAEKFPGFDISVKMAGTGDIDFGVDVKHNASFGTGSKAYLHLLLTAYTPSGTLCVDEPEAFLSTRYTRSVVQVLLDATTSSQLVLATHDAEVIRSLLDLCGSRKLHIIRMDYPRPPSICSSPSVRQLFVSNQIRVSNAVDSLFHDITVFVDGDSDVRFYSLLLHKEAKFRDILFVPLYNKDNFLPLAKALQPLLRSSLRVIVDADSVSKGKLSEITELFPGETQLAEDIKQFRVVLNNSKALTKEFKAKGRACFQVAQHLFKPSPNLQTIDDCQKCYDNIAVRLESLGFFVCPKGEVEGWLPSIGGSKKAFISKVLQQFDQLERDGHLNEPTNFLEKVLGVPNSSNPVLKLQPAFSFNY